MLIVDGAGTPIGFHLDSAGKAEVRLAEETLCSVRVRRQSRGRPRTRPALLTADRAYDSRAFRQYLRGRGIRACIPPRRRPTGWKRKRGRSIAICRQEYGRRWVVERTFTWLGAFRRLLTRWEYHARIYRAFFVLALVLLCFRKL